MVRVRMLELILNQQQQKKSGVKYSDRVEKVTGVIPDTPGGKRALFHTQDSSFLFSISTFRRFVSSRFRANAAQTRAI